MATRSERERRERRYADVNDRLDHHDSGFTPTAFKPPEGVSVFRFKKEGATDIDILPYEVKQGNKYAEKGDLYYERTLYTHRRIGPDRNDYCCLRLMYGERCRFCEEAERLGSDRSEQGKKKYTAMRDKQVQMFKVRCLSIEEERKKGTQIYYTGYFKSFGALLQTELNFIRTRNRNDERLRFWRTKGGCTLSVFCEEDKMEGGVKYMKPTRIDIVPRKHDYDDRDIDDICLDDLPVKTSYDKMCDLLDGTGAPSEKRDPRDDYERSERRDDRDRPEDRGRDERRDDRERDEHIRDREYEESRDRDRRDERDERDDREARQGSADDRNEEPNYQEGDLVIHEDYGEAKVVGFAGDDLVKIEVKGGKIRTAAFAEIRPAEGRREEPEPEPRRGRDEPRGRDREERREDDRRGGGKLTTASDKGLKVGYKVDHKKHGRCTIVHISADETSAKIRDSQGEVHNAIGIDELERTTTAKTESSDKDRNGSREEKADDKPDGKKGRGRGKGGKEESSEDMDPLPEKSGRSRR